MQNESQTRYERIEVFKNSVRFKNDKRIINLASFHPWPVYDTGNKLSEATRDYGLRIRMMDEFQQRYGFDAYKDYWTRNPNLICDVIGKSYYTFDDETNAVNYLDANFFEDCEYGLIGEDLKKFLWTCVMPRKYPNLTNEDAAQKLVEASKEYDKFLEFTKEISSHMESKFGVINFQTGKSFTTILDSLFINWRGMYKLGTDLRRNSEMLEELTKKFFVIGADVTSLGTDTGSDPNLACDFYFALMSHSIMSVKQFEKFFYPALKFIFDYAEERDKIGYIMIQGASDWLWDYFSEAPSGRLIYQLELDDIFKAKKVFDKKVALAGGFPVDLLGGGSERECVDYAKKLIDEIGCDGAFVFATNKMLAFPHDAKRENLLAINNYVAECRLK